MACIVCDKIKEKKAVFIYEDDLAVAILPAKPAVPGHIKIMPKMHVEKLEDLPDDFVERVMLLSSFSSAAVFDVLKAQGTNIIMNETGSHLSFDVIPRKEGDGLDFSWKPKESKPEDLDATHSKISDKTFVIGKKEKQPEVIEMPDPEESKAKIPDAKSDETKTVPVNYQLKNLERIP